MDAPDKLREATRLCSFYMLAGERCKLSGLTICRTPKRSGNTKAWRPGYFFIDSQGVIHEEFFEAKYRTRPSGSNVIPKMFPELAEEVTNTVEAPHLELAFEQSDRAVISGSRITLTAEVRLPRESRRMRRGRRPIRLSAWSSIAPRRFK